MAFNWTPPPGPNPFVPAGDPFRQAGGGGRSADKAANFARWSSTADIPGAVSRFRSASDPQKYAMLFGSTGMNPLEAKALWSDQASKLGGLQGMNQWINSTALQGQGTYDARTGQFGAQLSPAGLREANPATSGYGANTDPAGYYGNAGNAATLGSMASGAVPGAVAGQPSPFAKTFGWGGTNATPPNTNGQSLTTGATTRDMGGGTQTDLGGMQTAIGDMMLRRNAQGQEVDAQGNVIDSRQPRPPSGGPTMSAGGSPNFNEAAGNYTGGMGLSNYLDPSYNFARDEGLNAVKNSYAAAGNFLSGPAMKGITNYAADTALNKAWQPAFGNYMADKNFNYGVDNADRNFAYNAQTGDRNFNYGTLRDLANLGMQGTQGAAQGNNWLAALQAQLAQAGGQAAGAGTMGQGNALTNAISQILGNMGQNNILNRIFPQG